MDKTHLVTLRSVSGEQNRDIPEYCQLNSGLRECSVSDCVCVWDEGGWVTIQWRLPLWS